MNVERFLLYAGWILEDEDNFKIQERLDKLSAALATLAGSPAEPTYQQAVSSSLTNLREGISALMATYDTVQERNAERLGWSAYFTHDLTRKVEDIVSGNAMTPAVAQQSVAEIVKERATYIQRLRGARANLRALNFGSDALAAGQAEIGFELPRTLFDNELGGLVQELRAVRRILRVFSELEGNAGEPITVRQISTTDPIFYFGLDPTTIAMVGGAFAWALARWKMIEDIRKVRADTRKISSFTEEDIKTFFDNRIEAQVKRALELKTNELIPPTAPAGRAHEQRTELSWALESILARVERGMTVDVRFSLPPKKEDEGQPEEPAPVYDRLSEITQQLSFPQVDRDPVLPIPRLPGRQLPRPSETSTAPTNPRRRRRPILDDTDETAEPAPGRRKRASRRKDPQ